MHDVDSYLAIARLVGARLEAGEVVYVYAPPTAPDYVDLSERYPQVPARRGGWVMTWKPEETEEWPFRPIRLSEAERKRLLDGRWTG